MSKEELTALKKQMLLNILSAEKMIQFFNMWLRKYNNNNKKGEICT